MEAHPSGGDVEAADGSFDALYDANYRSVVHLARLLTGDTSGAEDVAQEVFTRYLLYGNSPGRVVTNPRALLRSTTVNVCRTWHTAQKRRELRMVRHGPDPAALTEWERELDASLHRLPYERRAVVVLRYWLQLSEREIANVLGCRPGTVKSRHARALRSLRKDLS